MFTNYVYEMCNNIACTVLLLILGSGFRATTYTILVHYKGTPRYLTLKIPLHTNSGINSRLTLIHTIDYETAATVL